MAFIDTKAAEIAARRKVRPYNLPHMHEGHARFVS